MVSCWATGMAMPVVVSGPVVRMNAGKRSAKARPEKEKSGIMEQLGEWTQKTSLAETDPVLKKGTAKKDAAPSSSPPRTEKKDAAPSSSPPRTEKKGPFGF